MRLPKNHIDYIAFLVYKHLKENSRVTVTKPDAVVSTVRHEILENLRQEEELQREAEELLRNHRQQILQEGADYRRMVQEGMKKLARQKGFVL